MTEKPTAHLTLQALYRHVTGDTASHQRAIHARYLKLDNRRRHLIDQRVSGRSLRAIAKLEGCTAGSVQSAINGAMEAIRKDIAGEARYNRVGRKNSDAAEVATPTQPHNA